MIIGNKRMATNFDFLLEEPKLFDVFVEDAISVEKLFSTDLRSSMFKCRYTLEGAIKWIYAIEGFDKPYDNSLQALINNDQFKQFLDNDQLWYKIDNIRKFANGAVHGDRKQINAVQAKVYIKDLFLFMQFLSCLYSTKYDPNREYNEALLNQNPLQEQERQFILAVKKLKNKAQDQAETIQDLTSQNEQKDQNIKDLSKQIEEQELTTQTLQKINEELEKALEQYKNQEKLLAELAEHSKQNKNSFELPKTDPITEYETRKIYIDTMLEDLGWIKGKDWFDEYEIEVEDFKDSKNKTGKGRIDYLLIDDDGVPLAIVEAKRTTEVVENGRFQAKLYAEAVQKKFGHKPVIFLCNGYETRIICNDLPERVCANVYSKRDLQKLRHLGYHQLKKIEIDHNIVDRYYQIEAITAVSEAITAKKRKHLVVMATGTGKTRTVIALCDLLLRANWIKNVLFLADRTALVTQAQRSFKNLLQNYNSANLVDHPEEYNADLVFCTYQTMINLIDQTRDQQGKIFSTGHFDLIICDEAHRSIYNKYQDIFNYFDAILVGLTATPKDEIDHNTYEVFELTDQSPTYSYGLKQAVSDGYLVDYAVIKSELKFVQEGIHYDDLTDQQKEAYENEFIEDHDQEPRDIAASEINKTVFNEDTILKALEILMEKGLRIDSGEKLGKTIIFAMNHKHAEFILKVFNTHYATYGEDYAEVIDNQIKNSQQLIDRFSAPNKLPQIAISVDMLDTGIDVPSILNLVFFKVVKSKAKFWQMIGRGTRLCPDLFVDELGETSDKTKFYIFDFYNNFDFFSVNQNAEIGAKITTLQSNLFCLEMKICKLLQKLNYQNQPLIKFRKFLVELLVAKVRKLDRNNSMVRQHLEIIDRYSNPDNYQNIKDDDLEKIQEELAPLMLPNEEDTDALRFDALVYGVEVAYLSADQNIEGYKKEIVRKATALSKIGNIDQINAQRDLIHNIIYNKYLDRAGFNEFENIRNSLRDLMRYIKKEHKRSHYINIEDQVVSTQEESSNIVESADNQNYRERMSHYIKQHLSDNPILQKLHTNIPLTNDDVQTLEKLLWNELGSKEDFEKLKGEKPLGYFIRNINGLDRKAAKYAFSEFLVENSGLTGAQIHIINQIIEYIVLNGLILQSDLIKVIKTPPFEMYGGITAFASNQDVWNKIKSVLNDIENNANTNNIA